MVSHADQLKTIAHNLHELGFTSVKIADIMNMSFTVVQSLLPQQHFTESQKCEAVKRVLGGEKRDVVAREIGATPQALSKWKRQGFHQLE